MKKSPNDLRNLALAAKHLAHAVLVGTATACMAGPALKRLVNKARLGIIKARLARIKKKKKGFYGKEKQEREDDVWQVGTEDQAWKASRERTTGADTGHGGEYSTGMHAGTAETEMAVHEKEQIAATRSNVDGSGHTEQLDVTPRAPRLASHRQPLDNVPESRAGGKQEDTSRFIAWTVGLT